MNKSMDPALHNPSLGKNVIFVKNEDEALREMKLRAGCDVRPVCAPPDTKPIYYISKKGKMYIFRHYKGYYVLYELAPRMNNGRTPVYELKTTSSKYHNINIERLVYCTFVAGKYIDKLKIYFKDGNPMNFDAANLKVKNLHNEDCARRMGEYTKLYQSSFNIVVSYIAWRFQIDKEDAQDVAQDAFVDLLERKKELIMSYFVGLWIRRGIQLAIKLWNHNKKRFQSIDFLEKHPAHMDVPYELDWHDVLGHNNSSKCFDLYLQGASYKEIADETGLTFFTVGEYIKRDRNKLRQYLLTDREIAKIYANR